MNTIVVPCRNTPSESWLNSVLVMAGGDARIVLSLPHKHKVPRVDGAEVFVTRHNNAPDNVHSAARTIYYHNEISVPLVNFASQYIQTGEFVIYLHDNIVPDWVISHLLGRVRDDPKLAFASVGPRAYVGADTPTYDFADRCLAWNAKYFKHYVPIPIPDDAKIKGTSIQETMTLLDEDGVKYVWTTYQIKET